MDFTARRAVADARYAQRNSYNGYMKRVGMAELKNSLSRYVNHVRAGGSVIIYDRSVAVAQILPVEHAAARTSRDADRLARLQRKGLIRRGKGGVRQWLHRHKPVRATLRKNLVDTLLQERESGW
jgi:prevent-host-death family protein